MKRLFWKWKNIALVLSMGIILLVSQSCKSHECCSGTLRAVQDSIYHHDSIICRKRTVCNTVYITKEIYRDMLEAKGGENRYSRCDQVL